MTIAEIIAKLTESIKETLLLRGSTRTTWKNNIVSWLQGVAQYGAFDWGSSREDLRQKALWFDLSRREFADLVNAYVAASAYAPQRTRDRRTEAVICGRCNHLTWWADQREVWDTPTENRMICSGCVGSYYRQCGSCGHYRPYNAGVTFMPVQHYAEICTTCLEQGVVDHRFGQCEHCRRYYQHPRAQRGYLFTYDDEGMDDPRGTHLWCISCRTPERSRCRPSVPEFDFPALCLGAGQTIHSGELKEITIGGGDVSATGIRTIYDTIFAKTRGEGQYGIQLTRLLDPGQFDPDWQTKEGNMPKRIAKILLTQHNLKLTDELMAELGNIGKAYTTKPSVQHVRLDRVLGRNRNEYVNDNSCWWTDYWYSRCTLKSLGGFAVRCFNGGGEEATARGWMLPLRFTEDYPAGWRPSPDLARADGFVVFNVYDREGRLEAMHFGRMLAQMTGKSYKRVGLRVHNMYVNGGDRIGRQGYSGSVLIAEQSLCDRTRDAIQIRSNQIPKCQCGVPA